MHLFLRSDKIELFFIAMDDQKLENLKIQLQQLHNEAYEFVQSIPPTQLYGAIGVVIFTIFFFLITVWCSIVFVHVILHSKSQLHDNGYVHSVHLYEILVAAVRLFKRRASNTIVLTGLNGSGKTVLFYQLRDGSSHQGIVTSMEPNEDTFVLHSETAKKGKVKPVHIVDVPGHSRLRPKLDEFLPLAAGIVFVVDAVEFLPNVRAASEYLYDILTKASVVKRKIPLLLLCNKVDKVTAHTKDFIRKQLEKELDKLRASRTALSSADIANEYSLGVPGEAFAFHQCLNKISVAETSGSTGDISQLEQFIREYVQA
ncbi:hypothetical protein SASPL_142646 [Salvia splendens]|uniref:Signal recognition particle receptor subunit beta n=1 Tax=Salvia splendens TaxID=180675 RepID=A0A8X8WJH6_SALSN|nr:hypothetical protein SASPL_142646 [Salvia splendens]